MLRRSEKSRRAIENPREHVRGGVTQKARICAHARAYRCIGVCARTRGAIAGLGGGSRAPEAHVADKATRKHSNKLARAAFLRRGSAEIGEARAAERSARWLISSDRPRVLRRRYAGLVALVFLSWLVDVDEGDR